EGFLFSVSSASENKYRTDPSLEANLCFTTGNVTVASAANRARKLAGKFVICAKSNFLSAYSAWYICPPRYAGSPIAAHISRSSSFDFPSNSMRLSATPLFYLAQLNHPQEYRVSLLRC